MQKKVVKLFSLLKNRTFVRGLLGGVAAGTEHIRLLRNLNCRYVVDIGANRGQFALVARRCFPDALIVSFEPLPGPSKVFRKIFRDDSNARLYVSAIGSEARVATIHISARDDSSSLLPIDEAQSRVFPGTQETDTTVVEVRRLDELLKSEEMVAPALLKLDVQGYELEALRGCGLLLSNFTWVYCECSFLSLYQGQALADEVITWLRQHGFHLTGVYNVAYARDGKAVQADFLFKRI